MATQKIGRRPDSEATTVRSASDKSIAGSRGRVRLLFLMLFLLFLGGIITTLHIINKTTANLTALLLLHKVEVIRQDLVINVQTVQSNLYTIGTSFGKELDIIVDNVLKLRDRAQTCSDCHHEEKMGGKRPHGRTADASRLCPG